MYCTGDLARLLVSGSFEILGRKDNQVKLKGYRIELEEVSDAMMQHPQVIAAAAIVKDKTHLVGYFSPANVDVEALQKVVETQLPVYMVPAVWVGLDVLPQNSNGKIDRKALALLDVEVRVEALETEAEHRMAAVWADVLNVDVKDIGRNTSFFALGGDSISIIKVAAGCAKVGLAVTVPQLIKASVLWRAASDVAEATATNWPSIVLGEEVRDTIHREWAAALALDAYQVYPVTPLQAGMVASTMIDHTAYIAQHALLIGEHVNVDLLKVAFQRVVEVQEVLRTTFVTTAHGVYQVIRNDCQYLETNQVSVSCIETFLKEDYARGFGVGDKYFIRLTMVSAPTQMYAVITMHHALYDGWSTSMMMSDWMDAYAANAVPVRPNLRGVIDYVEAQDKEATQAYWRSYLSGVSSSTIGSRGQMEPCCDDSLVLVPKLSMAAMMEAARRVNVTVAIFVKLAWAATLRKYTRQNDVVFGQVMSNRNIPVKDVDRYRVWV
jgi:hypothetical protein